MGKTKTNKKPYSMANKIIEYSDATLDIEIHRYCDHVDELHGPIYNSLINEYFVALIRERTKRAKARAVARLRGK